MGYVRSILVLCLSILAYTLVIDGITWVAGSVAVMGILVLCNVIVNARRQTDVPVDLPADAIRAVDAQQKLMLQAGADGALLLGNVLILHSSKKITALHVTVVATHLMRRHPLLRARIKEGTSEYKHPYWTEMDSVTPTVTVVESQDWKSVLENQLLTLYDTSKGPLWRLYFLDNTNYDSDNTKYECSVVFGFHHAIIDGTSYSHLFAEFTDILDSILNREIVEDVHYPIYGKATDYIKPSELPRKMMYIAILINFLLGIGPVRRFILRMMKNSYVDKFGIHAKDDVDIKKMTRILPVEFSKELTSKLLKCCKEFGCTVQGALQTAVGIAIADMLSDDTDTQTEWPIPMGCTVNLRPFFTNTPVPPNAIGTYFSGLQYKHKYPCQVSRDSFWTLAKQGTAALHDSIKAKSPLGMLAVLELGPATLPQRMVGCFKEVENLEGRGGRTNGLAVFTNLGYAKHLEAPRRLVSIRARYGCSAEQNVGNLFANNVITFNGHLFYTFVYYQHVTSQDTAQKYASKVQDILQMAVEEAA